MGAKEEYISVSTSVEVQLDQGYYHGEDNRYYHITGNNIIHVNVGASLINVIDRIYKHYNLQPITKEQFEMAVRNTVLDIGIYKYVTNIK